MMGVKIESMVDARSRELHSRVAVRQVFEPERDDRSSLSSTLTIEAFDTFNDNVE